MIIVSIQSTFLNTLFYLALTVYIVYMVISEYIQINKIKPMYEVDNNNIGVIVYTNKKSIDVVNALSGFQIIGIHQTIFIVQVK